MRVLVLGAGYGTRLAAGIQADSSGKYDALLGLPKPLLPLAGTPLLTIWLQRVKASLRFQDVDDANLIAVVCNERFAQQYLRWADENHIDRSCIVNDGTSSNASRLGAVADISFAVRQLCIDDDVLILGGDTLLHDADLAPLIDEFNKRPDCSLVTWYFDEDTSKSGILETNDNGLVTEFLEKPDPSDTTSRMACPCFYIFRREVLPLLHSYVDNATSLKELDAPGTFLKWLYRRENVHALQISGRFDIGDLQLYIEADEHFRRHASSTQA